MKRYILGVDEVGRGSLAGPVTVGSALLPSRFYFSKKLPKLRDSKKLTELQRERWFEFVLGCGDIFSETSSVTSGVIDRIGISEAVNRAATRSVKRLLDKNKEIDEYNVYTDGMIDLNLEVEYKSLIKGDERINAIKVASIVAKVTRDRKMVRYEDKIKGYRFDKHKGYGTLEHREMIEKHGPSDIHRLTFLKG